MKKPNNYDKVQPLGGFIPVELGGHILEIKKVEEYINNSGNRSIKITYDMHSSDKQPGHFMNEWKKDDKADKKYRGIYPQVVENSNGDANVYFVTFIKSVESSNQGFKFEFDEKTLTGKLVGAVFGREQFEKDGELKFATKIRYFTTVDSIKKGVPIPKDKLLSGSYNNDELQIVNDGNMPF